VAKRSGDTAFVLPSVSDPFSTIVKIALDALYTCRDDAPVMPPKPIELTEAEWTIIKIDGFLTTLSGTYPIG